jgi:NADP-dependent 3-hydroxy acid dehydrogenase YdfG
MVSLKAVRASNAAFKESKQSVVALFVGATAGIGMSTLQNLAKTAYKPRIYVVGRSKSAAAPLMNGLNASNPEGTFIFIESEISLMKRVDEVCDEIKSKEKKLDLLFISPGNIDFGGRNGRS